MIPPQKRAHLVSLLYQAHSSSKLLATREPDPLSSPRFPSSEVLSNCLTAGEPYGPDPRKVDTSGVSYAAWASVADVNASKVSGARRLHQECRLRVL